MRPSGDSHDHVRLAFACLNLVIMRLFMQQKSSSLSPLSFIPPIPCVPIIPFVSLLPVPTFALKCWVRVPPIIYDDGVLPNTRSSRPTEDVSPLKQILTEEEVAMQINQVSLYEKSYHFGQESCHLWNMDLICSGSGGCAGKGVGKAEVGCHRTG